MISLTDLKAKRAAMTQGEWYVAGRAIYSEDECNPTHDNRVMLAGAASADTERAAINRRDAAQNATGIVATHNAADCLIEIAEAALAYRDAPFEDCNACLLRLAEALDKVSL